MADHATDGGGRTPLEQLKQRIEQLPTLRAIGRLDPVDVPNWIRRSDVLEALAALRSPAAEGGSALAGIARQETEEENARASRASEPESGEGSRPLPLTSKQWALIVAVINAIGEISKQEAVDALERELFQKETA